MGYQVRIRIGRFVSHADGVLERLRSRLSTGGARIVVVSVPLLALVLFSVGYTYCYGTHLLDSISTEHYFRGFNCDDSFYYNKIALNFAGGHFSTFDGVNLTNGYHPLWMFLLIPVYLAESDLLEALVVIKHLEFALLAAALAALFVAARLSRLNPLLLLAVPSLFMANFAFYNGMEVAVLLLTLSLLWLGLALKMRYPGSRAATVLLSVVLFLIPWARLEAVSVSLFVPLALAAAAQLKIIDFPYRSAVRILIVAAAGFAVYLLYNYLVFDIAVPVSGVTKAKVFCGRLQEKAGGLDPRKNFFKILAIKSYREGLLLGAPVLLIGLSKLIASFRWRRRARLSSIDFLMAGLALGHLSIFVHAVFSLCPKYSNYPRYFAISNLLEYLLLPYVAYCAYALLAPRLRSALLRGIIAAGLVAGVFIHSADYGGPFETVDRVAKEVNVNWGIADYYGAQVLNAALSPGDIVGSTDAGILGYFVENRLINLDGLVNSNAFYVAFKNKRLGEWIEKSRITHFANVMLSNQRSANWFFGELSNQEGLFRGTAQLAYEGTYCYGRSRQLKIWRYSPREQEMLPVDQNKARFFKTLFRNAQKMVQGRHTLYLTNNVFGIKTEKCSMTDGYPSIWLRVFPKDPGDINIRFRKQGYRERWVTRQFSYRNSCYGVLPMASFDRRRLVVRGDPFKTEPPWSVDL